MSSKCQLGVQAFGQACALQFCGAVTVFPQPSIEVTSCVPPPQAAEQADTLWTTQAGLQFSGQACMLQDWVVVLVWPQPSSRSTVCVPPPHVAVQAPVPATCQFGVQASGRRQAGP